MEKLTVQRILDADLADWRQLAQGLHARFLTGDFATGAAFVTAVGEAAELANHHPDIKLTYPRVDVTLVSHDAGGVTRRDVELARSLSEIARQQEIKSSPQAVAQLGIALDTADLASIGPFWAAILTGSTETLDDIQVVDPSGQVPALWFQSTDNHETPRQRFHLDLWVPHDQAQQRIKAAVAAGGRVVDDTEAPSFTVLADAEANKVCVCTCLDRDE